MKKITVALLSSLAFAAGAHAAAPASASAAATAPADSPAATAAARDLMEAMNYRTLLTASLKQMSQSMPTMLRGQAENAIKNNPKLNEEQRKAEMTKVEQELPKVVTAMQTVLDDPALIDDMYKEMVPLYQRHFSAAEMKQLAAFYRTPVGAKSLQTMPLIMREAMQLGQRVVMPRLQKVAQSMQKKG